MLPGPGLLMMNNPPPLVTAYGVPPMNAMPVMSPPPPPLPLTVMGAVVVIEPVVFASWTMLPAATAVAAKTGIGAHGAVDRVRQLGGQLRTGVAEQIVHCDVAGGQRDQRILDHAGAAGGDGGRSQRQIGGRRIGSQEIDPIVAEADLHARVVGRNKRLDAGPDLGGRLSFGERDVGMLAGRDAKSAVDRDSRRTIEMFVSPDRLIRVGAPPASVAVTPMPAVLMAVAMAEAICVAVNAGPKATPILPGLVIVLPGVRNSNT